MLLPSKEFALGELSDAGRKDGSKERKEDREMEGGGKMKSLTLKA